jgi:hypothetical protein
MVNVMILQRRMKGRQQPVSLVTFFLVHNQHILLQLRPTVKLAIPQRQMNQMRLGVIFSSNILWYAADIFITAQSDGEHSSTVATNNRVNPAGRFRVTFCIEVTKHVSLQFRLRMK